MTALLIPDPFRVSFCIVVWTKQTQRNNIVSIYTRHFLALSMFVTDDKAIAIIFQTKYSLAEPFLITQFFDVRPRAGPGPFGMRNASESFHSKSSVGMYPTQF